MFSVGRLDAATEGLLIITNDGDLAQRISHPSFGVEKEYLAEVAGVPVSRRSAHAPPGCRARGRQDSARPVGVVAPGVLRIVVHEGRNRLVRRMCEAGRAPGAPPRENTDRPDLGPDAAAWLVARAFAFRRFVRSSPRPSTERSGRQARTHQSVACEAPWHPAASVRALRGATTVDSDTPEQVTDADPQLCSTRCSNETASITRTS